MRGIAALTRNPLIVALFLTLAIAGCANKKTPNTAADLGLGGASTPGSSQDFTVNVGDRIFFDTDSSVIRADAQGILARQAQWLNKYKQYAHRRRRPCRRTRHARIQSGAGRTPRCRDTRLSRRARRRRQPHEDDLLRQGTAGRRLRRHLLLVAEPPRGHDAERRRKLTPKGHTDSERRPKLAAFFV